MMKRYFFLMMVFLTFILINEVLPQKNSDFGVKRENSILKNFKPFPTPRTSDRPGTVYRIDKSGKVFNVEDVEQIESLESEDGTLVGRIYFTKNELLEILNLEFNTEDLIPAEVEIKEAVREYNEQVTVDKVLWENDHIDVLIVDDSSKYFIIRETIAATEITFRFSNDVINYLITGKGQLKEQPTNFDFPFEVKKKYRYPKRMFFLDQEITKDHYGD